MTATPGDSEAADPVPGPGIAPQSANDVSAPALVLTVDGELFELRHDEHGGTDYDWVSGPNEGYGFGSTPTRDWSVDQHRENIRSFLAQIDPTTGYIGD
jgi:hypothetical protein